MALVSSKHFLGTTRALLRRDRPERPLDLFRRANIPKTPGYQTLRFYEVHGAVRTARGIETDPRRILTLQGGLRAERAIPDRSVPRGPPLERAARLLDEHGIAYAIGFQTAANLHAYFEPAGAHTLYVDRRGGSAHASGLMAQVETIFSHDAIHSAPQPYEVYLDDLARLDIQEDHRGRLTSPLQTLLDLCVHSRTAAHREFLFDQLQKQGVLDA